MVPTAVYNVCQSQFNNKNQDFELEALDAKIKSLTA